MNQNTNNAAYSFSFSMKGLLRKIIVPVLVIVLYLVLLFTIKINVREKQLSKTPDIFKMVDVEIFVPVQPEQEQKKKKPDEDKIEVAPQESAAERVVETDKEIIEKEGAAGFVEEIDYLPQHLISEAPVFPTAKILDNMKYPVLANKQKIEGVVYLELYIDSRGKIRKITVLRDPGYGLAEAAVEALEEIVCAPARANGKPVAVRFRYPIRFTLK